MLHNFFKRKPRNTALILWFKELGIKDVPLVGGKNASLGEMYQKLTSQGIHVPNGFAISAQAYFYFIKKAGLRQEIKKILADLNTKKMENLCNFVSGKKRPAIFLN